MPIAELIRRQREEQRVVLGALSPRTRNAQVALYQSGDVDFLVATDAIGMGLNLDVDHWPSRPCANSTARTSGTSTANEIGQTAGRAGGHMNDGTFASPATPSRSMPISSSGFETHNFDPVRVLQWRNRRLDFAEPRPPSSDSRRELPDEQRLTRARMADDVVGSFLRQARQRQGAGRRLCLRTPAAVGRLWEVRQTSTIARSRPRTTLSS